MIRCCGIDVGNNGAIALIVDGRLERVEDMPIVEIQRGKTVKRQVSAQALVGIIKNMQPTHAAVEKVASMPNQGVASMFAFGRSAGVIEGVLAALEVPVSYVQPAVWARTMNKGYGKDASRHRAMELHPEKQEWFKLVKHDGRAEAVLIAMWGMKQL
jgi:crossover junction endodeoxyribonuclease RuvC